MGKVYLARLLPLDYLEKIGRYQPEGKHHRNSGITYPPEMMRQLRENAGRILSARIVALRVHRKGKICLEKCASLGEDLQWYIPINWLVRVKKADKKCQQKYKHVPGE